MCRPAPRLLASDRSPNNPCRRLVRLDPRHAVPRRQSTPICESRLRALERRAGREWAGFSAGSLMTIRYTSPA